MTRTDRAGGRSGMLPEKWQRAGREFIDFAFGVRRTDEGSIAWVPLIGGIAITLISRWLRQQLNQSSSRGRGRRRR